MATIDELIEQLDSQLEDFRGPEVYRLSQRSGALLVEGALELLLAIVKEMRADRLEKKAQED